MELPVAITGVIDISSSFVDVDRPDLYIYLVMHELLESVPQATSLRQLVINFGKLCGDRVSVTAPFMGSYAKTRKEIMNLNWDSKLKQGIESTTDPFLLITKEKLTKFSPDTNTCKIVFFSGILSSNDEYANVIAEISQDIESGHNIFDRRYLGEAMDKPQHFLRRMYKAIEAKPGAFGITLDLKQVFTPRDHL